MKFKKVETQEIDFSKFNEIGRILLDIFRDTDEFTWKYGANRDELSRIVDSFVDEIFNENNKRIIADFIFDYLDNQGLAHDPEDDEYEDE